MKRPSALPPTLTASDIPGHIHDGCTLPYSVLMRGTVLTVAYIVMFLIGKGFQAHILSKLGLGKKIIDVVTTLSTVFVLFKIYSRVWEFITNEVRSCKTYNSFIEYYNEMTMKGMKKEFAIGEALELIKRDQETARLRQHNLSYERRLDNRNSIRVGL